MKVLLLLSVVLIVTVASVKDVCELRLETGPCKALFPRFGYDPSTGKCVLFKYGGCEGNANNFRTLKSCWKKCVEKRQITSATTVVPSVCDLKLDPGSCYYFYKFLRFGYDSKQRKCVSFIYRGCQGNGNNFRTRKECEKKCVEKRRQTPKPEIAPPVPAISVPTPKKICHLELETGPCYGLFNRFGYDPKQGKCVSFDYGGCQGNANNFETREECEAQCVETRRTTTTPELISSAPQTTPPAQTPKSACNLKLEAGRCKAEFPRFGYDPEKGECVVFVYGGCQGNANNFETREECEAQCVETQRTTPKPELSSSAAQTTPPVPTPESVCDLKLEAGPCKAEFLRYGYDPSKGKCVRFIYGGCDGNKNNFPTRRSCEKKCVKKHQVTYATTVMPSVPQTSPPAPREICDLKLEYGPCYALFYRFGYDSKQGKCVIFVYGGCQGNANNFETREECEAQCVETQRTTPKPELISSAAQTTPLAPTPKSVCDLKLKTGLCKAKFDRFGYDPEKGECVVFVYGGCQGNANNFETREECEAQCVETQRTTPKPELSSSAAQTTPPVPTPESVCDLKLEAGPCKAEFLRYGFVNGRCEAFTYGGCEGNGNNFPTKRMCERRCGKWRRTLLLPE